MVLDALKRLTSGPKPVALLFALLLTSLYLMSGATQNSTTFGQLYSLVLVINIVALVLLVTLILRNLITLVLQYRRHTAGSRLTVRLVVMFVLLSTAPVSVVYYFAVQFLHRGIDSWFDVRVERALEDALELGRTALDGRLRDLTRQTRLLSEEFLGVPDTSITLLVNDVRLRSDASELTLLTLSGRVIASSSSDPTDIIPTLPNNSILLQLQQGLDYTALEPLGNDMHVRVAVLIDATSPMGKPRVLQALYPMVERTSRLAESVQGAFAQYKELAYLRQPLKYSFTLTLSLVLLLSLLTAVWAAFFSSRRLVAPISDLAEGTRAVAAGDYDTRLPLPGKDELGFLVRSFNEMTRKLARARDEAKRNREQVEGQRAYLEAVLGRLSSGVLTLDNNGVLRTANGAAGQVLNIELNRELGKTVTEVIAAGRPTLAQFFELLLPHLQEAVREWRAEIVLFGPGGRQVLMCRGSSLPNVGDIEGGHVIVFDDITALIQAQRDAAWGEVARRLAHEIKNPLTPIQLSAERLRRKYLQRMPPDDAEVLDRATHTIVQQVETMKEMVKAFSDYARPPNLQLRSLDLNSLIREVAELYRGDRQVRIRSSLGREMPPIEADAGRLRQVLHNLFKNALEAGEQTGRVTVRIATRCATEDSCRYVELTIEDTGPGFPDAMIGQLFEPYVTTKPRGSGLGLAIVKKIVEEHGGMLWAENIEGGGARITVRLPVRGGGKAFGEEVVPCQSQA